MEGSRRHSSGEGRGRNGEGRVKTNGRRREGTRWEHVSHTEIVNYSFVLRRVGVIWRRDGGGRRGEYRGGMDGERRRYISRGTGEENDAYTHTREWERERERDAGVRDATRARERDDAFPVSSDR